MLILSQSLLSVFTEMATRREFPYFYLSECALRVKENTNVQTIATIISVIKLLISGGYLYRSLTEGKEIIGDVLEISLYMYWLSLVANSRIYHKKTVALISILKQPLHDYEFNEEPPELQNEIQGMYETTRLTECVILASFTKSLVVNVFWPTFQIQYDDTESNMFPNKFIVLIGTAGMGLTVCFLGSCFHIGYQVFLVNAVTCLRKEMRIMAQSVSQIDLRVKKLMAKMKIEAEMFHWNELPSTSCQRVIDVGDHILWEVCLKTCLAENIRHHQKIIR